MPNDRIEDNFNLVSKIYYASSSIICAPNSLADNGIAFGAQAPVVSTHLNLALPLIIKSYASAARSSGKTSFIGLTPDRTLNDNVSCESMEVPDGQPTNDRRPWINRIGGTSIGSSDAPIMTIFPSTARPPSI